MSGFTNVFYAYSTYTLLSFKIYVDYLYQIHIEF